MTHINTNVVASKHIKREEVLLPVAVRHSKTPELNLNFIRSNENVTHSAQSELSGRNGFFGGNFLFRISEYPRFANYRFPFRKLQISISQTTDFHFANYRFSFRKLQIFISFRSISFCQNFVSLHFVSQTTVISSYMIPIVYRDIDS